MAFSSIYPSASEASYLGCLPKPDAVCILRGYSERAEDRKLVEQVAESTDDSNASSH